MSWLNDAKNLLTAHSLLFTLFVILVGGIGLLAWRAQRDRESPFDILDLLSEDGKLSTTKVAFVMAFLTTSWVVVDQEMRKTLDSAIFTSYLVAWVGPLVARVVFDKKDQGTLMFGGGAGSRQSGEQRDAPDPH